MKTAGVKEFKAHLSQYLREVQTGETLLITDRGHVVAELRPPGASSTVALTPQEKRYLAAVERGIIFPPAVTDEEAPLWQGFKGLGLPEGTAQELLDADRTERDF